MKCFYSFLFPHTCVSTNPTLRTAFSSVGRRIGVARSPACPASRPSPRLPPSAVPAPRAPRRPFQLSAASPRKSQHVDSRKPNSSRTRGLRGKCLSRHHPQCRQQYLRMHPRSSRTPTSHLYLAPGITTPSVSLPRRTRVMNTSPVRASSPRTMMTSPLSVPLLPLMRGLPRGNLLPTYQAGAKKTRQA